MKICSMLLGNLIVWHAWISVWIFLLYCGRFCGENIMIENCDLNSRKLGLTFFPEWCSHFWYSLVWCVVQCWAVCCVAQWCLKSLLLTPPIGGDICLFFMLFLQLSFTNCTVVSFNAANISKGLKKYKKTQKCLKKLKRHDNRTGEL